MSMEDERGESDGIDSGTGNISIVNTVFTSGRLRDIFFQNITAHFFHGVADSGDAGGALGLA